jgi:hypothetical protein
MQARTLRVLHRRAVQTGIPTLSVGTRNNLQIPARYGSPRRSDFQGKPQMKPQELLNHITDDLKTALGGELPQLCHLERTTRQCQQPDEVKQALKDFQPQQGWLCFQSTIVPFKKGELPDKGTILYGEVKGKNRQALHIQQNGNGGWLLTTFQEQEGDTHLVEYTQLLGEFDDFLHYRVFWQQDGDQGYRPICAAFNGFFKE